jgi:acyl-CoA thioesterase
VAVSSRHHGGVSQADIDFHQLRPGADDGQMVLTVEERLCTPFGFLYGGTGISAATTVAESVAGKPLVWITVQYVSNAFPGEDVTFAATVVAAGRSTTQIQIRATVGDRLILTAMSSHTDRPTGDEVHRGSPPAAPLPDELDRFVMPFEATGQITSFVDAMDRRIHLDSEALAAGHLTMWVRMPSWSGPSAARLGHIADVVPVALFLTLGRSPGATSLDNTLRVIDPDATEWVLMDVEAQGLARSIGHGQVRMWSSDGRLLAVGSQSAILRNSHINRSG